MHVMRAKPGTQVVLFDGSGAEFTAQVEGLGRAEVQLAILSRQMVDRELPLELTLGTALPKGERRKWLVEKAVELGVTRIVPLVTSRCVGRPGPRAVARLRRVVIQTSKQCGRNRLAAIADPLTWAEFVASSRNVPCRLLAHPITRARETGCPGLAGLATKIVESGRVFLAVGPEGGFTSDELALATTAGWQPIDLGPRILRIETAAILLTAMVTQRLQ